MKHPIPRPRPARIRGLRCESDDRSQRAQLLHHLAGRARVLLHSELRSSSTRSGASLGSRQVASRSGQRRQHDQSPALPALRPTNPAKPRTAHDQDHLLPALDGSGTARGSPALRPGLLGSERGSDKVPPSDVSAMSEGRGPLPAFSHRVREPKILKVPRWFRRPRVQAAEPDRTGSLPLTMFISISAFGHAMQRLQHQPAVAASLVENCSLCL